jgi:hypothetical protein
MKNHVRINGQLLQTNKKWAHLKQKQRSWIYEISMEEYSAYAEEYGGLPRKTGKEVILYKVHDRINERDIWIPWDELKAHVEKMIDRRNRKAMNDSPAEKRAVEDTPLSGHNGRGW